MEVVSCTSQDQIQCADNLLLTDVNKKWSTATHGVIKVSGKVFIIIKIHYKIINKYI